MKKKMLYFVLSAAIILGLTGCDASEDAFSNVEKKEKKESTVVETSPVETKAETVETKEETVETSEVELLTGDWSTSIAYGGQIVFLDENGYPTASYMEQDLRTADYLTDDQKQMLSDGSYKGNLGNEMIYMLSGYCFEDGVDRLVALNPFEETYRYILNDNNIGINYCEVYDGTLYVVCYDKGNSARAEKAFGYMDGEFVEIDDSISELLSKHESETICYNEQHASYSGSFNGSGCLIFGSDGHYTIAYMDGSEKNIELDEKSQILAYNSKYMRYYIYDSETYESVYYLYDMESGESIELQKGFSQIYMWDDMVCTLVDEGTEYGISHNVLYEMNPTTGSLEEIASAYDQPGMSNVYSIFSGLTYLNGKIYYIKEEGNSANWYLNKYTDSGFSEEKLSVTYKTFNAFEYGTIDYLSSKYICENCGFEYGDIYVEGFTCTLDFKGVDLVNEKLEAYQNDRYIIAGDSLSYYDFADEEYHGEDWGKYTNDIYVNDACLLGTHYLAVTYGGYEYSGGAHGYPYYEQIVYDLNTGEEVKLQDYYEGSEEELRKLLAEKTKEDYESYGEMDYPPYFAADSEEVYESAYSCCLEGTVFVFDENGMTLNYYPYNMGPYAAGFIGVFIPYEELGFSFED